MSYVKIYCSNEVTVWLTQSSLSGSGQTQWLFVELVVAVGMQIYVTNLEVDWLNVWLCALLRRWLSGCLVSVYTTNLVVADWLNAWLNGWLS